ncbi:MAG: glycosyltransferase family 2 protein [Muribaculaceae bacterium]|nr:glycosyltransferase family 2 protein [Muribaculaceae bacterium]
MKVSVIIPAFNCADYICQTLNCVYHQTMPHRDIEVIVCLDAPTDNTVDVINDWGRRHADFNLRILHSSKNFGVSHSRNVAVRHARGEFIHFMDADDLINTDFYRLLYDGAIGSDSDIAVASYYHQRRPNSSIVLDIAAVISNPQDRIDMIRVDQHGMMWRYLIRRTFWTENKFKFPEDMRICEDWVLANKMVFSANQIVLVPGAVYLYRYRENSLITANSHIREESADGRRANMEIVEFFAAHNLRRCAKQQDLVEFRLFGRVLLFTIRYLDCTREFMLFGKWPILRVSRQYRVVRRQLTPWHRHKYL